MRQAQRQGRAPRQTQAQRQGRRARPGVAWLLAGVLVTVTAIGSASFGIWFSTGFQPDHHQARQSRIYPGTPSALTVRVSSGDVTVRPGQPGTIRVVDVLRWTHTKPSVSERWRGGTFEITQDCASGMLELSCNADFSIAIPPGVRLDLQTDSGDITVTGSRAGTVAASSASGDISLAFDAAPGLVNAIAYSGNLTVAVPPGLSYDVLPIAASGNLTVTVPGDATAPRVIHATSDDGNVTIRSR